NATQASAAKKRCDFRPLPADPWAKTEGMKEQFGIEQLFIILLSQFFLVSKLFPRRESHSVSGSRRFGGLGAGIFVQGLRAIYRWPRSTFVRGPPSEQRLDNSDLEMASDALENSDLLLLSGQKRA